MNTDRGNGRPARARRRPPPEGRALAVAFVLAIGALAAYGAALLGQFPDEWHRGNDWAHYYVTGRLLSEGENPYRVPLTPSYDALGFTPATVIPRATNPPALAALTTPLCRLSPERSFRIWTALQLAALLLALHLAMGMLRWEVPLLGRAGLALAAVVPFGTLCHLAHGQTQALVLLLVVLGARRFASDAPRGALQGAFLLGVATSLKLFTLPLVYVAWRYGGARSVLAFLAGLVAMALPLLAIDPAIPLDYVRETVPFIEQISSMYGGNISLRAALTRTVELLGDAPLADPTRWTRAFDALSLALLVFILGIDHLRSDRRDGLLQSISICLVVSCLLGPTSWNHYLVLTFVPFLVLLDRSFFLAQGAVVRGLLLADYVLIGVTLGELTAAPRGVRILSLWIGVAALIGLLALLIHTRRASIDRPRGAPA